MTDTQKYLFDNKDNVAEVMGALLDTSVSFKYIAPATILGLHLVVVHDKLDFETLTLINELMV